MSAKGWEIRRLQVNPQSRTVEKDTIPIPTGLKIVTRGAVSNHHTAIRARGNKYFFFLHRDGSPVVDVRQRNRGEEQSVLGREDAFRRNKDQTQNFPRRSPPEEGADHQVEEIRQRVLF